MEIFQEYLPILERTVDALEQIIADKENGKDIAKKFVSEMLLDGNEKLELWLLKLRLLMLLISKALVIAVIRALNPICTTKYIGVTIVRPT